MKLSVPIYQLKRKAKQRARDEGIDLLTALDRLAAGEGFESWSLLAAKYAASSPAEKLYAGLKSGDMLLIGARPGLGKTLLAMKLAVEAVKAGKAGLFFTLEYTEAEVEERLASLGIGRSQLGMAFEIDCSDAICADYIIGRAQSAAPQSVVVIDYLQLLDQKREHPPLADQVRALKAFATERKLAVVCIAQIARSFDRFSPRPPNLDDVRLPNPINLALFTKTFFIGNPTDSGATTA